MDFLNLWILNSTSGFLLLSKINVHIAFHNYELNYIFLADNNLLYESKTVTITLLTKSSWLQLTVSPLFRKKVLWSKTSTETRTHLEVQKLVADEQKYANSHDEAPRAVMM